MNTQPHMNHTHVHTPSQMHTQPHTPHMHTFAHTHAHPCACTHNHICIIHAHVHIHNTHACTHSTYVPEMHEFTNTHAYTHACGTQHICTHVLTGTLMHTHNTCHTCAHNTQRHAGAFMHMYTSHARVHSCTYIHSCPHAHTLKPNQISVVHLFSFPAKTRAWPRRTACGLPNLSPGLSPSTAFSCSNTKQAMKGPLPGAVLSPLPCPPLKGGQAILGHPWPPNRHRKAWSAGLDARSRPEQGPPNSQDSLMRAASLATDIRLPEALKAVARHKLLYYLKNNNSNILLDLVVSNNKADQAKRLAGDTKGREERGLPDRAPPGVGGAAA